MSRYKITWQTEYNGKLGKDDEPRYFDDYRAARGYMKDIISVIKADKYLSDRQIVRLYYGTKLVDKWDSMPKRSQVMKARAKAKKNADRRA